MSDAGPQSICYSKALFNSITDAVVQTMKISFTARLLVTALSVAALSSAAHADDLNLKTMIPCAPQIDAESWYLSITIQAKCWRKITPIPPRPGESDQNDDQLRHWSGHESG